VAPVLRVLDAHKKDLGGFQVGRLLPAGAQRAVGPFVFFDHMGPASMPPGRGVDVGPHPHIGLATVTWLFEGEIVHRDSLGTEQTIAPGALNWMSAGEGIVHSERSSDEVRARGAHVHGVQLWAALPREQEQSAPSFQHVAAGDLPRLSKPGVELVVIAGEAYGARSPVVVHGAMFYVEARLQRGAVLEAPKGYAERAVYVVEGAVRVGGDDFGPGRLVVLRDDVDVSLLATEPSLVMLLGGAPLDGPRHLLWNFVSSDRARLEAAAERWRTGGFPAVPGDEGRALAMPGEAPPVLRR
jgi:hypothetical protein